MTEEDVVALADTWASQHPDRPHPLARYYRGVPDERLVNLPEPIRELVDGIAD